MTGIQLVSNTSDKHVPHQSLQITKENTEKNSVILKNAKNLFTTDDSSGSSHLHHAAKFGNEVLIQFIIKSGAKVNLQNEKGETPLMLATKGKHEAVIKVLLDNKADIYIEDENGVSALELVVQQIFANPGMIEMFFAVLVNDRPDYETIAKRLLKANCPLFTACCLKNAKIVEYMLSKGTPIDATEPKFNETALHVSVRYDDYETVEFLVQKGANINALDKHNQTPLKLLKEFKNTKILKFLINNGATLNSCTDDGVMQVYTVLTSGTRQAVEIVVESGFDFYMRDQMEQTILHCLANNVNQGITDFLEKCIDKIDNINIDWNARDKYGKTPLHIAMFAGNPNFVMYLIKKGANLNAKDNERCTPLYGALVPFSKSILEQRLKCVNLFKEHGGNVKIRELLVFKILNRYSSESVGVALHLGIDFQARDSEGQTFLHCLASNINEGVFEVFNKWMKANVKNNQNKNSSVDEKDSEQMVNASINWNAKDKDGKTPLHNAMVAGNADFVEYLLKKGVDLNVVTATGSTPFFAALERKTRLEQRVECVKLIMQNGALPDIEISRYFEKYNASLEINRDFEFLKPLLAHLVIREAKGEQISEKLLESICCHSKLQNYVEVCREELNYMKKQKLSPMNIEDKPVNLFDFLIENTNKLEYFKSYRNKLKESIDNYKLDSYYFSMLKKRHYEFSNPRIDVRKVLLFLEILISTCLIILLILISTVIPGNQIFFAIILLIVGNILLCRIVSRYKKEIFSFFPKKEGLICELMHKRLETNF